MNISFLGRRGWEGISNRAQRPRSDGSNVHGMFKYCGGESGSG